MDRKINKLDNCHVEVIVNVEKEKWQQAQDKAFEKEAKKVKIDGFRAGKAPLAMVKKHVNQVVVLQNAADIVLQDEFNAILNEEKIQPVTQPKADVTKISPDEIELKFVFTTAPEVKLGKYKGIEIGKQEVSVNDEDVEKEIQSLLKSNATLVVKEGKAELGDTVVIDFVGSINGEPFEGGSSENYELELGSHQFIPGFEEQLVGHQGGEQVEVNVTFPENYIENLKGKPAVFAVTVHEVKQRKLPELTDEFVKDELKISGVENVVGLYENKRKELTRKKENSEKNRYLNKLLEEIEKDSEIAIADEILDNQVENRKQELLKNIQQYGLDLNSYLSTIGQSEEEFMKGIRDTARKEATNYFLLDAIIKEEKIEVSNEEIDFEIAKLADQYKMEIDKVKEALANSMGDFINNLRMNRVEEFLLNNNN